MQQFLTPCLSTDDWRHSGLHKPAHLLSCGVSRRGCSHGRGCNSNRVSLWKVCLPELISWDTVSLKLKRYLFCLSGSTVCPALHSLPPGSPSRRPKLLWELCSLTWELWQVGLVHCSLVDLFEPLLICNFFADDWLHERSSNVFYIGEPIAIEASVRVGHHMALQVFVSSCVATLDPDMNSDPRYVFIENG